MRPIASCDGDRGQKSRWRDTVVLYATSVRAAVTNGVRRLTGHCCSRRPAISWRRLDSTRGLIMKAIFVAFHSDLDNRQLAGKRRRLATLLSERGIELVKWDVGKDINETVVRLAMDAMARPVIAVDDKHGMPNDATWLETLTQNVKKALPLRRPQVVYVTSKYRVITRAQAHNHPVVQSYIKRDEEDKWIDGAHKAVLDLVEQLKVGDPEPAPLPEHASFDIVGESQCFLDAVDQLGYIVRSPYGFVTGDRGSGKMFLIQAMWRDLRGNARIITVPCASFFKDTFIGTSRRRTGGGREAIDQFRPFLAEAQGKLLVLHHVEDLPTALQEELAVRLPTLSGNPQTPFRLRGVDRDGLAEYDMSVIATSAYSPEMLGQTGRLVPELLTELTKRHVRVPSLAERGSEDIRILCKDIVFRICIHRGLATIPRIDARAEEALCRSALPGNLSDLVRILDQAVERSNGIRIRLRDLPKGLAAKPGNAGILTLDEVIEQAKKTAIENALHYTGGNVKQAADLLGRHKGVIHRMMKDLGIRHRRG